MKHSKAMIVIVAVVLGLLTVVSAKLMAAPTRGATSTPCRTPNQTPSQC
jgi:hypothetical protein